MRNLAQETAFYERVFGMQRDPHRGDEATVFLRTPGAQDTLTLRLASPDEAVGSGGGMDHFGFRLADRADLESAIAEVIAAGGSLMDRVSTRPAWGSLTSRIPRAT